MRISWPPPRGTPPPPALPRASSVCGILWASSSPAVCWKTQSPTRWCCTVCPPPGEEISTALFEQHADEIFDEAENRLHVQKAVLAVLLAGK